jgi:transcription-repair coupling factor (superfamily II helicase)
MYAWRKVAKGFRYPPLGELYREFEASFGFEETPDQAKAIQDVLADMEKLFEGIVSHVLTFLV